MMLKKLSGIYSGIKKRNNAINAGKRIASGDFSGEYVPFDVKLFIDDFPKILRDAEEVLSGKYQIYNYEKYENPIWNKDPVSKITVKGRLTQEMISISHLYGKADVKNYWEQSHLHPIITLAEAYCITGLEKYAEKAVELTGIFIRENPCGKTICWKCHMDSAIRLANIVEAMALISKSECFRKTEKKIHEAVIEHIVYISSDYEDKGDYPNNHYLTDLTGVLFGTAYIWKNYKNEKILNIHRDALKRLYKEAERQITDGGFDYEFSSYYHCFVTELFLEATAMLRRNKMEYPEKLDDMSGKMSAVCEKLGAFGGRLPLIGDQDGSRLFHKQGCFDIDRCDFSSIETPGDKKEGKTEEAGIYILENPFLKVFFKCGKIGTGGKGTHDHNDQLSVCIFAGGENIVADSGSFCYTNNAEKRRHYRSVKAHSTVYFEDKEQNDISGIFKMKTIFPGNIVSEDKDRVKGEFIYPDGEKHEREVLASDNTVTITDIAEKGTSRLIIPVGIKNTERLSDKEISFEKGNERVKIISSENIILGSTKISGAYGVEEDATFLDSSFSGKCTFFLEVRDKQ